MVNTACDRYNDSEETEMGYTKMINSVKKSLLQPFMYNGHWSVDCSSFSGSLAADLFSLFYSRKLEKKIIKW